MTIGRDGGRVLNGTNTLKGDAPWRDHRYLREQIEDFS